jgi:hypothetical protein
MSDREVEVTVQAEGVDDAAGELGGDAVAEGPAVGAPGGGGDGGGGGRSGRFGKLLTRLLGLLAFLGPILDVLGTVSKVLTAFVAPVAVLLFRLLTPALRLLLAALPLFFDFIDVLTELVGNFQAWVLGAVRTATQEGVAALIPELPSLNPTDLASRLGQLYFSASQDIIQGLSARFGDQLAQLPSDIGAAVARRLPNLPSIGGGGDDGGLFDRFSPFDRGDSGDGGDGGGAVVNLEGGLDAFVNRITKDKSLDFP